jgi:peroxiredoxin
VCKSEAPSVEAAAQKFSGSVNVVGVAWQGSDESMQGFIDNFGLSFPQVNDDPAVVFDRFEVPGQPAWVFISRDGSIQQLLGAASESKLDELLSGIAA